MDATPLTDCLLVVVCYRSATQLASLLNTVPAALGELSWHTLIVNNDTDDDLGPIVDRPRCELVESGDNLGYAGGLNRGLLAAPPSRWTVFLNPDLRLAPGSIARLAAAAGDHDVAVPTILDDDGVQQRSLRHEPSLLGSLGDAVFGDRWPGRPPALSEMVRDPARYGRPGAVDWATGAALLVPTDLVSRAGPWDAERFFLYSEETDYCRRLRELGATIRFEPEAVVHHHGAGSGTSDALHALQEVNRVRYFRKWHGALASAGFAGVVIANSLLRSHRRRSRTALNALLSPAARAGLPGGAR